MPPRTRHERRHPVGRSGGNPRQLGGDRLSARLLRAHRRCRDRSRSAIGQVAVGVGRLASRLRVVAVDAAIKSRNDILIGVCSRAIGETKLAEAFAEKREIDPTLLALVDTLAG